VALELFLLLVRFVRISAQRYFSPYLSGLCECVYLAVRTKSLYTVIIIIIIIIGTTAPFESRSSSEASASCPYSLQHSSNFSPPNFLTSSITPSSHLSFGLPLCLLPSTTATRTLLAALCSSIRITCLAHFNRLILMYVTISLSFYNVYNSLLSFILHSPLSFVGPKIALQIFLSKTPKIAPSHFDNTHVSEAHASTGLIKVWYNFILFFMDNNWDLNCLFNS